MQVNKNLYESIWRSIVRAKLLLVNFWWNSLGKLWSKCTLAIKHTIGISTIITCKNGSKPFPLLIYPSPQFSSVMPLQALTRIVFIHVYAMLDLLPLYEVMVDIKFSGETRAGYITSSNHIAVLWKHGYFGKGILSRSEPIWLDRERYRRGVPGAQRTYEEITYARRKERAKFKLQRAHSQYLALESQIRDDKRKKLHTWDQSHPFMPIDRFEASTQAEYTSTINNDSINIPQLNYSVSGAKCKDNFIYTSRISPVLMHDDHPTSTTNSGKSKLDAKGKCRKKNKRRVTMEYSSQNDKIDEPKRKGNKRQRGSHKGDMQLNEKSCRATKKVGKETTIVNKEHLQLSLEESFFLMFELGVGRIDVPLKILNDMQFNDKIFSRYILDEEDKKFIRFNAKNGAHLVFQIFRAYSYYPPLEIDQLRVDDPFVINYVVYRHYRSLGWIVRSGLKFAVDYLLYLRGPTHSHAQFAVVILPNYSSQAWRNEPDGKRKYEEAQASRTWPWLHCLNRVQSHVLKTLILVYVEIPIESSVGSLLEKADVGRMISLYKIRELCIQRWVPNRHRD